MRVSWFAVLVFASACSGKSSESGAQSTAGSGSGSGSGSAAPVAVKKPIDTTPLPALAKDPGGAKGTPLRSYGFGGLGSDPARGIAVDAEGNAYVVGYFDEELDFGGTVGKKAAPTAEPKTPGETKKASAQAYVLKLDSTGTLAWVDTWGGERDDVANAVAVRGDEVAVAGNFLDEIKVGTMTTKSVGSDDAIVAVYNKAGEPQWVWKIGGIDSDGANAIAATPDGGWVVGGSFMRLVEYPGGSMKARGGTDAMLIKLGGDGTLEWVKQFGGAYVDSIQHVAVDAKGNIVIQGVFRDVADWGGEKLTAAGGSDNDVVLAKYDLNGDHLWSQRFGNAFNDVAGGVTIDPAGFITMVGSFDQSASFGKGDLHKSAGESDIFVSRFSPAGELQWAKTFGADREDIASGVVTDMHGATVVTGWFHNKVDFGTGALTSKGNKDIFALKLDVTGGVVWAQRFGDKDHDQARAIALDTKGIAYITGLYRFGFDTGLAGIPVLQSVRKDDDRVPKADSFVLVLER